MYSIIWRRPAMYGSSTVVSRSFNDEAVVRSVARPPDRLSSYRFLCQLIVVCRRRSALDGKSTTAVDRPLDHDITSQPSSRPADTWLRDGRNRRAAVESSLAKHAQRRRSRNSGNWFDSSTASSSSSSSWADNNNETGSRVHGTCSVDRWARRHIAVKWSAQTTTLFGSFAPPRALCPYVQVSDAWSLTRRQAELCCCCIVYIQRHSRGKLEKMQRNAALFVNSDYERTSRVAKMIQLVGWTGVIWSGRQMAWPLSWTVSRVA